MANDRRIKSGWFCILALVTGTSACSIEIPARRDRWDIKPPDPVRQTYVDECINRLNNDAATARVRRNESDTVAIAGAIVSAGTGLSSAILAASLPPDTAADDHRTQKIAAAVTGGLSGISAVIAVIAKLVESPTEVLKRRGDAERHYTAGEKALSAGNVGYAAARFIDCASATAPPEVPPLPTTVPTLQ